MIVLYCKKVSNYAFYKIGLLDMKLKKILSTLLLACVSVSFAQQKKGIEYSGFFDSYYFRGPISFTFDAGTNLYFGDLSNRKVGPNISIGASYKLWPRVAFGGELTFISASATDHVATRGYNYKGTNFGLTGYGKYYLREDIVQKHHQLKNKKIFKPYLQLGITGLYFSTTTTDINGDKLPTQAKTPITLALPAGFGADFIISNKFTVAPEFLYYYTFSDNIDNVSKDNAIGVSSAKDSYLTMGIKLTFSPFAPRKKPKKLSGKELEMITENKQNSGGAENSEGGTSTEQGDGGAGSVQDTETEEEYGEDEDLLQLEEEVPEEETTEENLDSEGEETEKEEETTEDGWGGDW